MGQEQAKKSVLYGYGGPGQQAESIRGRMHTGGGDDTPPPVGMGNVNGFGCLLAPFALAVMILFKLLDLKKTQLQEETERYRVQMDYRSTEVQAQARLEDSYAHLQHGFAPGLTLGDIDRSSLGASPVPATPKTNITMNGYNAPAHTNPYDIDLPPADYNFKGDDDE